MGQPRLFLPKPASVDSSSNYSTPQLIKLCIYTPEAEETIEKKMAAANISSNWKLIKTLEPYVHGKTDDYEVFTDAVRQAVDNYLPELIPAKEDIVQYMCLYHQVFEEA